MIESWGFYFFSPGRFDPDEPISPEDQQQTYDRYLDLWASLEELGFDGVAFAEHHFNPVSLSPSTHLVVAAVAARTRKLRLTTLGSVLALHDARRYVEEVGMLDYLTQGRFEPGIAPGAGDAEPVKGGIPSAEVRPRYYSGAEVLAKAIASTHVTHHDAFYNLERVPIIPRMRPETGRSVWVTVMSPDSAAWTAERGWKMCTAWTPVPVAAALATRYREAADAAGRHVSPTMLGLRRRVFVAPSDAEAQEKYEAAVDYVLAIAGKAFETVDDAIRARMFHPDDFAIGSPQTVAERLIEQCRAGGYGAVMHFPDFAGFEHADFIRCHQLIGTQVAPLLRSANIGAPAPATA